MLSQLPADTWNTHAVKTERYDPTNPIAVTSYVNIAPFYRNRRIMRELPLSLTKGLSAKAPSAPCQPVYGDDEDDHSVDCGNVVHV